MNLMDSYSDIQFKEIVSSSFSIFSFNFLVIVPELELYPNFRKQSA